jgi:hypothetical protein
MTLRARRSRARGPGFTRMRLTALGFGAPACAAEDVSAGCKREAEQHRHEQREARERKRSRLDRSGQDLLVRLRLRRVHAGHPARGLRPILARGGRLPHDDLMAGCDMGNRPKGMRPARRGVAQTAERREGTDDQNDEGSHKGTARPPRSPTALSITHVLPLVSAEESVPQLAVCSTECRKVHIHAGPHFVRTIVWVADGALEAVRAEPNYPSGPSGTMRVSIASTDR